MQPAKDFCGNGPHKSFKVMIQKRMKGIKFIVWLCMLCGWPFAARAQQYLDSLRTASASEVLDTNTVVACNLLAEEILADEPEKAIELTRKALRISLQIQFRDGITWSHSTMGTAFEYADRLDSAIANYETARNYKIEFADTQGMARMDQNIGVAYLQHGYYRPASEAFYRAMRVFERLKDKKQLSRTYNNLGLVYRGTKNYKVALEFYYKSMALKKELDDITGQGLTYTNISSALFYSEQYEKAEKVALEGYEFCKRHGLLDDAASCMVNASQASRYLSKFDDCRKYLAVAEDLFSRVNNDFYRVDYLMAKAEFERAERRFEASAKSALEAMVIYERFGRLEHLGKCAKHLSDVYSEMNMPHEALKWLNRSVEINDTIFHRENIRQVNEMQIVYKTQSKEKENEGLRMENRLEQIRSETSERQRNILFVSLLVFIVLGGMVLRLYWQKNQAYDQLEQNRKALENAVEQKDTLLRELHHRVKNNLQVVTGLLDLQMARIQDPDIIKALNDGKNRIRSMALIHQKLYRTDDLKSVDMQEYFEKLLHEIHSGFAMPDKDIKTNIQANGIHLDIDVAIPLGLVVNELATNSFKYAFQDSSTGSVNVLLHKEGEKYILRIGDSGPGYDHAEKASKATLGLRLVNMLVKQIRGVLEIHNFSGTELVIQF